jgi:hypothetical protein
MNNRVQIKDAFVEARNGSSPARANTITYTVVGDDPSSGETVRLTNVAPRRYRRDGQVPSIYGAEPGDPCMIWRMGATYYVDCPTESEQYGC